jgi:hypothetical protein
MHHTVHIHLHDAFEEGQHPRGEGGRFSVSTKAAPHHLETHTLSTKSGPKTVKAQKHDVHVNGEHIGHVQTHTEHKLARSVGRMRPTGETSLRWIVFPKEWGRTVWDQLQA